jgi:hypothetical protein
MVYVKNRKWRALGLSVVYKLEIGIYCMKKYRVPLMIEMEATEKVVFYI